MKKTLAFLVAVLMLILCSCGSENYVSKPSGGDYSNNQYGNNGNTNQQNNNYNNDNNSNLLNEAEIYCDQLVSQGDTLNAYLYIVDKADENTIYNGLHNKYAKLYMEDTLKKAKNYADSGNYEQAVCILQEGNKVYNCSEFSTKIEEYKEYMPCKLAFCQRIDEDDYEYMLYAEDCFGNQYQEVFGFSGSLASEDGGYVVFYLNGKYSNISGKFVGSNELYEDMEVACKIYSDGKLIYESAKLGRTSAPVNINLDVTGTEQLRIEYIYYTWWTTEPACIFDLTAS